MNKLFLFCLLVLFTLTSYAASGGDRVAVIVAGSVAKPSALLLAPTEATLSAAIEHAGGIIGSGSDTIHVTYAIDGVRYLQKIRGRDFYAANADYRLPDGAEVFVLDCEGVGLGNLTPAEYAVLQECRKEYLVRLANGEVRALDVNAIPGKMKPESLDGARPIAGVDGRN